MFEAAASEFPFVGELPKREKSKVRKALDMVREFSDLSRKHGALIPVALVAPLLNVSRQRVHQLVKAGDLPLVRVHGTSYVPEDAFIEFCKLERTNDGISFKAMSVREAWRASVKLVKTS